MKIITYEQGSQEWIEARLGMPTASKFSKIITPKTLKPSTSNDAYLYELVAEYIIGESMDMGRTEFMERGNELEDAAVRWYEFDQDSDTQPVGFATSDDGRYGCSPDRLVGSDGGAEIKCPKASTHIRYLLNPGTLEDEYRCQIQGALWICERDWWDAVCYNPSQYLPNIRARVHRDEPFIEALSAAVLAFCDRLDEAKERAKKCGCLPWRDADSARTVSGGIDITETAKSAATATQPPEFGDSKVTADSDRQPEDPISLTAKKEG